MTKRNHFPWNPYIKDLSVISVFHTNNFAIQSFLRGSCFQNHKTIPSKVLSHLVKGQSEGGVLGLCKRQPLPPDMTSKGISRRKVPLDAITTLETEIHVPIVKSRQSLFEPEAGNNHIQMANRLKKWRRRKPRACL